MIETVEKIAWPRSARDTEAATDGRRRCPSTGLADIRACVFDAYGTLFDFASAARACRDVLGDERRPADRAVARQAAAIHVAARRPGPPCGFLAGHRRRARFRPGDAWGSTDAGAARAADESATSRSTSFPEVPEVLRRLKARGHAARRSCPTARPPCSMRPWSSARLDGLLDAVLSVEEAGVYKPHPKVYQLAVDRLGVPAACDLRSSRRTPGTPMRPRPSA